MNVEYDTVQTVQLTNNQDTMVSIELKLNEVISYGAALAEFAPAEIKKFYDRARTQIRKIAMQKEYESLGSISVPIAFSDQTAVYKLVHYNWF